MRQSRPPSEMGAEEFRALGHWLVDRISDFLATAPQGGVCGDTSLEGVLAALGKDRLPATGGDARAILERAFALLRDHSVLVSHPRFWAYVHGSASPLAALGDLLAAIINSPVTSRMTGPMSSAIESQTVRWLAELVGYPRDCGGLFTSGGSIATVTALHAALHVKAGWDLRGRGVTGEHGEQLRLYVTSETHSCVRMAATLLGLGSRAVTRVATDEHGRMIPSQLRRLVEADRFVGLKPVVAVGTAGSTNRGAVDPLPALAELCRELDLWFHVDGAYGGVAAVSPEAPLDILGLREADSVVIDPHKWLYIPLEAGCLLIRDNRALYDTFCSEANYYSLSGESALTGGGAALLPYRDQGPQTSRGFRALKVWLALQHRGRDGYRELITQDIRMARRLYELVDADPSLEACSHGLSVTNFRYVPPDLAPRVEEHAHYLDDLNRELLRRLQESGEAYPSHTTIDGKYVLRVCIVNHNTLLADVEALPGIVVDLGAQLDKLMR